MGVDDWLKCPKCTERLKKAFQEIKDDQDVAYDLKHQIQHLKMAFESGSERHISELGADIRYEDIEKVEETTGLEPLFPIEKRILSVRLDKNIKLDDEGLSIGIKARCRSCGYVWEIKDTVKGDQE